MEKTLNLTIVCTIMNVEFTKKNEKLTKYQAVIMYNEDNKSKYLGVKNISCTLHEEMLTECKESALEILKKKEKDFTEIDVNAIMV